MGSGVFSGVWPTTSIFVYDVSYNFESQDNDALIECGRTSNSEIE